MGNYENHGVSPAKNLQRATAYVFIAQNIWKWSFYGEICSKTIVRGHLVVTLYTKKWKWKVGNI